MERKNKTTKQKGNGEGTLFFSNTLNCYVGQYVDPTGKRQTMKQKKNEGNKEFKQRFNDKLASIRNGTYIEKSNDTFITILEKHIEQKHKDNLVGDSSYLRDLATKKAIEETCSNFVNKPIQKVTTDDIENAKDRIREYSNSYIGMIWRLLYKTFKIAISRRKIIFNPMDSEDLTKPVSKKETKKVEALTIAEENKFKDCLTNLTHDKTYRDIALLQLYTGMRIGEILSLSVDNINIKDNTIHVCRTITKNTDNKFVIGEHTKTYNRKLQIDKGERTFPMTLEAKNLITKILNKKQSNIDNLLFWDYERCSFISPRRIKDFLNRINKEYNISKDLESHKLRHTFITRCQEKGIPLVVIQAMVGHIEGSNITNDTYTSVSLEFMKNEIKKII